MTISSFERRHAFPVGRIGNAELLGMEHGIEPVLKLALVVLKRNEGGLLQKHDGNDDGSMIFEGLKGVEAGPVYTQAAIDQLMPGWGGPFIAITIFFFAFTTILGYYFTRPPWSR